MSLQEIAPGIVRLPVSIANVYFVGVKGSPWFMVDSGTPGHGDRIQDAAISHFGENAPPEFILLTHGHFDHSGSACELAESWHVPIYAHHLETPYLTGQSPYPPQDPTVGGAMAFLSRFFSTKSTRLQPHLRELPANGEVPGHPEWQWLFTPGHAPGHISLYDSARRVILAGDAFATVDLDSPLGLITQRKQISRPPAPFTCDWVAARESVRSLASLQPHTVGCGHGSPMSGSDVATDLNDLAVNFPMPEHGRYVPEPAQTDERGIRYVPPAVPDPLPKLLAAAGITAALVAVFAYKLKANNKMLESDADLA